MGKQQELMQELKKKQIDIAVITETEKKNKGTQDWEDYILIYSGVPAEQRASLELQF
jgi:hypothetical protein